MTNLPCSCSLRLNARLLSISLHTSWIADLLGFKTFSRGERQYTKVLNPRESFKEKENRIVPGPACLKYPLMGSQARQGCQWPTGRLHVCMNRLHKPVDLRSVHRMVDSAGKTITCLLRAAAAAHAFLCGLRDSGTHPCSLQFVVKARNNTQRCASSKMSFVTTRPNPKRQHAGGSSSGERGRLQEILPALSCGMISTSVAPHLRHLFRKREASGVRPLSKMTISKCQRGQEPRGRGLGGQI